ncbi:glycosyl transferase [Anoxybacillus gonensis]|uniref:Glycosyltransferase family 39 protein n=1 Tax=Anoxybacillus gonensis TaxID=198467 RepID=A0AAW7TLC5_9BACL|nr:glycosyltransferase family 39 protein [Anoxybacillus gonensis]AKS38214.1 glycosyl transferase [Anoxybacillus gonensis]KGP59521.1 glycosyl transferase [Anoxybacillus gonensis]MCX8047074.1 glycosyltransferase family 39 protein [Anoxybacillus gonensis]MDO0878859.1 glycosyltransferase family 39 protein [Anoxybacillus gonensis]
MKEKKMDWWLIAIIALASFLYFYNIGNAGSNEYYTAAAKSMTANWKAFFFASLDPAGFITVDKPPVALWFQALSVALFGVSDWSVLLPEALAGVLSTSLLYFIVKPFFGRVAARWASFIFACTPIFVAVTRTNNLDTILIFTLLVATWALIKSIHTKKATSLLVSFALVGVGFNMKMMQAYMVLPAFYIFYWLAKNETWKRKMKQLALATVVLLMTSLSYAAIADLMPKDNRPYIGSSQTNSVLELALGYNGIGRLTGSAGPGGNRTMDANAGERGEMPQPPNGAGQLPNGMQRMGQSENSGNTPPQLPEFKGGGGIGIGETGNRGIFRLFNQQLSGQISWLLPFVLFSTIAVGLSIRKQRMFTISHKVAVFWLAWLIPMMGFFSIAGFFHRYYLSMMAPAIAALVAIGSVLLWEFYKEGKQQWLLPSAFLATFSLEAYILYQNKAAMSTIWIWFVGLLGLASFVLLLAFRQHTRIAYYVKVASLVGLLLMPFYWALTPILYGGNSMIPAAGPQTTFDGRQDGRMMGSVERNEANEKLIQYLEKNYDGETYLVATFRATEAAQIMLKTDKAVMAMGGFSGNDPALTAKKLENLVKNGEVKYFLLSGFGGGQSNNDIVEWIQTHCKEIPQSEWKQSSDTQQSFGRDGAEKLYKYEG